MNSNFVLEAEPRAYSGSGVIRVTPEAYAVLTSLCARTMIPMNKIASRAILYAAEHLEIRMRTEDENGGETP